MLAITEASTSTTPEPPAGQAAAEVTAAGKLLGFIAQREILDALICFARVPSPLA